jgi:hypothetical protein
LAKGAPSKSCCRTPRVLRATDLPERKPFDTDRTVKIPGATTAPELRPRTGMRLHWVKLPHREVRLHLRGRTTGRGERRPMLRRPAINATNARLRTGRTPVDRRPASTTRCCSRSRLPPSIHRRDGRSFVSGFALLRFRSSAVPLFPERKGIRRLCTVATSSLRPSRFPRLRDRDHSPSA